MVRTPQRRGRRSDAPVDMINIRIDPELKHELKKASLDARVTVTTFVTRLIEEAVDGAGGGRAPGAATPGAARTARAGGATKLGFLIAPGLHAQLKEASLAKNVSVTEYLTRLINEAVSAAQGAR